MREHSRRVRLIWCHIGYTDRLLSFEVANSNSGNLNGGFRESGNAQNRACGWILRKIIGEDLVQFTVAISVFKVDLHINYMIHRQPGCLDQPSDILERLANLIGKCCWSDAVAAAGSLPRDIDIIPRIDVWRAQRITRRRR